MFQPPLLRRSSAMFQPPLLRGPASRLSAQARRERCIYDTCTTHGPHACFVSTKRVVPSGSTAAGRPGTRICAPEGPDALPSLHPSSDSSPAAAITAAAMSRGGTPRGLDGLALALAAWLAAGEGTWCGTGLRPCSSPARSCAQLPLMAVDLAALL